MAEKNNAKCSICGKDYYVCFSCKDTTKLSPWKIHCCSAECYKVFQVVKGFSAGVYTKEEFKSKLKNIDLSNLDNYREHIKVLINDTLKEPVVEIIKEEQVEPLVTEEVSVTKKTTASRKRNYKIEEVE